jgi:hypothetical protein
MADPRQPSWGEVLDTVLGSRLRSVHTAMVGEIRSYSEAQQTAEVTLAVQLEGAGGEFEALPPLGDVPVAWPGAWAAGDTCLLVFCEESFAKWWDTGSVEQPEVLRRHGLHAVCVPMVARAGQAVEFVALEPGVASVLNAFINATKTVIAAALDAGIPSAARTAFAGAATAVQTQITLGAMAATKVKAR